MNIAQKVRHHKLSLEGKTRSKPYLQSYLSHPKTFDYKGDQREAEFRTKPKYFEEGKS